MSFKILNAIFFSSRCKCNFASANRSSINSEFSGFSLTIRALAFRFSFKIMTSLAIKKESMPVTTTENTVIFARLVVPI